jgi:hypothetical protein
VSGERVRVRGPIRKPLTPALSPQAGRGSIYASILRTSSATTFTPRSDISSVK